MVSAIHKGRQGESDLFSMVVDRILKRLSSEVRYVPFKKPKSTCSLMRIDITTEGMWRLLTVAERKAAEFGLSLPHDTPLGYFDARAEIVDLVSRDSPIGAVVAMASPWPAEPVVNQSKLQLILCKDAIGTECEGLSQTHSHSLAGRS